MTLDPGLHVLVKAVLQCRTKILANCYTYKSTLLMRSISLNRIPT